MNNLELLVNWIRASTLRTVMSAIVGSFIIGAVLGLVANLINS